MAFEPLVKEEAPPPEPAVDPNVALNERFAAMQADLNAKLNEAYRQNKGFAPQVQYVPYPVNQPAPVVESDVLSDIPEVQAAIDKRAEKIAAQREAALREELGTHLGAIYEKDFNRDFKDLASHPYFKFVGEDLKAHFADHPDDRFKAGELQKKFNELVGSRVDDIQKARESEEAIRPRAVDHAIPVSNSAGSPVGRKASPEVKLDDEREHLRQFYNQQFGLEMSAQEWVDIESGKLLPKGGAGTAPASMQQFLSEKANAD